MVCTKPRRSAQGAVAQHRRRRIRDAVVGGFNNRRLLEPIGYVPPAEYDAKRWRSAAESAQGGVTHETESSGEPGDSSPPLTPHTRSASSVALHVHRHHQLRSGSTRLYEVPATLAVRATTHRAVSDSLTGSRCAGQRSKIVAELTAAVARHGCQLSTRRLLPPQPRLGC